MSFIFQGISSRIECIIRKASVWGATLVKTLENPEYVPSGAHNAYEICLRALSDIQVITFLSCKSITIKASETKWRERTRGVQVYWIKILKNGFSKMFILYCGITLRVPTALLSNYQEVFFKVTVFSTVKSSKNFSIWVKLLSNGPL